MPGASLLILSQLMWAIATVIGKKLLAQTSPLLFTAVVLPLAGVTLPAVSCGAACVIPDLTRLAEASGEAGRESRSWIKPG